MESHVRPIFIESAHNSGIRGIQILIDSASVGLQYDNTVV